MQKPFRLFSSLPWIVSLAGLAIFLATLNSFVSLASLATANEVAQWEPYNQTARPLLWLLTRPIGWIGGSAQFFAMNLLSAVLAAAALYQLARTVAILPHDRTRDQRNREPHEKGLLSIPLAWVPPVVAAMVCAFQLKFWEHATALTGEMLDLLVFAYCIRCLMEHRLTGKDRWVHFLALAYGLGVTNNAAMIAFFPFFVAALIWIRGMKFFQFPFLFKTVGFGVAGLSLYLLLPIVSAMKGTDGLPFGEALMANLAAQKQMILTPFTIMPRLRLQFLLMSMTSLVPLILIGFRWPSMSTETSSLGRNMLSFLFVVAGIAFAGAGIAGSFAVPFGPFKLGFELFPYLTMYYLMALSIGYFTGYVLLVLLTEPESKWQRSQPAARMIGQAVGYAFLLAVLAAPVLLAVESSRSIRFTNGPTLNFAMLAKLESLPEQRSAILSDDGFRLILLEAAAQKNGKARNDVLLDTARLKYTNTIAKLSRQHADLAGAWPTNFNLIGELEPIQMLQTAMALQKQMPLFYLHPSYGYYFEAFRVAPKAGLYELTPYAEGQLLPPPPTAEQIAVTSAYWDKMDATLFSSLLSIDSRANLDASYLKRLYSLELNDWGVTLQRSGNLTNAQIAFQVAADLKPTNPLDEENPGNPVAAANLAYNAYLQKPNGTPPALSPSWQAIIDEPAVLQGALNAFGLADEPASLIRIGSMLAIGGNMRQSLIHLSRALELSPGNLDILIALSMTRLDLQQPDEALRVLATARSGGVKPTPAQELQLINVESLAHASKGDLAKGESILRNALAKDRNNLGLETLLTSYYLRTGQLDRALREIDNKLALDPQDETILMDKSALLITANRNSEALAPLDKILAKNPKNLSALQNKATALFKMQRYPEAKAAYELLLATAEKPIYQAYFGLSFVAEIQGDLKEAVKQSELFLKHAPRSVPEFATMQKRKAELKKKL